MAKKLDITIHLLTGLHDQLGRVDQKLDGIQQSVAKMREELLRLTGSPVMEVYEEWKQRELEASLHKPQPIVYVPPNVCGPGPKKDFKPSQDEDNPEKPITEVVDQFMEAPNKQVLLLAGAAGSGKSTATQRILHHLLKHYSQKRKEEEEVEVVVLLINLPTLQNSLADLFDEGVNLAFGKRLRPVQTDELKAKVQEKGSKYEIVFILDGYDEQSIYKNLYRTNNLNDYRDNSKEEASHFPKVIVTCRSELLSGRKNYEELFWPSEMLNPDKKAQALFQEVRLVDFSKEQRGKFMRQFVALQLRDKFARRVPKLLSAPRRRGKDERNGDSFLEVLYNVCTLEWSEQIEDPTTATTSNDEKGIISMVTAGKDFKGSGLLQRALELLAALAVVDGTRAQIDLIFAQDDLWTEERYLEAFEKIPELEELTTTPFMIKVKYALRGSTLSLD